MCSGRLEQFLGRAHLHHPAVVHDHHLVGEGQRLGLVVGDVDHRVPEFVVQLLQLGPQLPLHMRIDHRQRLVEKQRVDVLPHHAAAQRDLLLGIGGQPARLAGWPDLLPCRSSGDLGHTRGRT